MRVQNREILQFFIFYSKLKILHFQGRQFLPKLYKMRNRNLSFNPPLFHRIGISRSGETLKLPLIKRVELTVISRGEARRRVAAPFRFRRLISRHESALCSTHPPFQLVERRCRVFVITRVHHAPPMSPVIYQPACRRDRNGP